MTVPEPMSRPVKAILFDLDNTLYDEREYIFGAFKDISDFLSERFPIRKEDCYRALLGEFEKKGSFFKELQMVHYRIPVQRNG